MEANSEIIDELKASVESKLKELDPDNNEFGSSLIDYIIVMIINQKNKYEMKHNLALFLGKISDDFVNWLFEHLDKLKNQSSNNNNDHKDNKIENIDNHDNINNNNLSKDNVDDKLIDEKNKIVYSDKRSKDKKERSPKKKHTNDDQKRTKKNSISSNKTNEQDSTHSKHQLKRVPKKKIKSSVNVVNFSDEDDDEKIEKLQQRQRQSSDNKRKISEIDEIEKENKRNKDKSNSTLVPSDSDEKIYEEKKIIDNNQQTKFFVTLDGVKNMFKVNDNVDIDDDDLFIMEEELDPELMNEDDLINQTISKTSSSLSINKKEKFSAKDSNINQLNKFERCRYWPLCMNGKKCEYYHPFIKCNTFPNCRFGDKCLYIHPICKYDSICSKKNCPFFHTFQTNLKRNQLMMMMLMKNTNHTNNICKYHPKCINPNCEFTHPPKIICHYGSLCKTFNCPYIHPPNNMIQTQQIPHPSQLKWSSSINDNTTAATTTTTTTADNNNNINNKKRKRI